LGFSNQRGRRRGCLCQLRQVGTGSLYSPTNAATRQVCAAGMYALVGDGLSSKRALINPLLKRCLACPAMTYSRASWVSSVYNLRRCRDIISQTLLPRAASTVLPECFQLLLPSVVSRLRNVRSKRCFHELSVNCVSPVGACVTSTGIATMRATPLAPLISTPPSVGISQGSALCALGCFQVRSGASVCAMCSARTYSVVGASTCSSCALPA
jgi:hypothetical protein